MEPKQNQSQSQSQTAADAGGTASGERDHELLSNWRPVMSLAMRNTSASSARIIQPQLCSSCSCSSVPRLVSRPPLSRYLQRHDNQKRTRCKRQEGGGRGAAHASSRALKCVLR
jgi:hypothetical protein